MAIIVRVICSQKIMRIDNICINLVVYIESHISINLSNICIYEIFIIITKVFPGIIALIFHAIMILQDAIAVHKEMKFLALMY